MPIYIDTRGEGEKEIGHMLAIKGYKVEFKKLESGDYFFNDVAIERKTISDLISSTISGSRHLWDQLKVLKDTYKKPLMLIEGDIDWSDKLLSSIIFSIVHGYSIPYINSSYITESVTLIGRLFDKYGSYNLSRIPPPAVKKAKTLKEIKWCMLQCVEGIGGVTAKRVLQAYPEIFSHTQTETIEEISTKLAKVEGLYSKPKDRLTEVLTNGITNTGRLSVVSPNNSNIKGVKGKNVR